MVHVIKRGLNLPIQGQPVQQIQAGPEISRVGLVADDYVGMRPTMLVGVGDKVKLGQPVFTDKKNKGVLFTAPGAGTVTAITRGEKRKFESLTIELEGDAQETFHSFSSLDEIEREAVVDNLVKSGLWTSIRTRPFSRSPGIDSAPHSIFVTAMDSNPLAAEPELIIDQHKDWFVAGLNTIKHLTEGKVFVCTRTDSRVPGRDIHGVQFEEFSGPHPSGLAGTHIHLLDPVSADKTVWYINYQDVIAIGHLFTTGELMTQRTIALGGPRVSDAGLFTTRLAADVSEFVAGKVVGDNNRVVSGSVLSGRKVETPFEFLGRFHLQVSVLEEGNKREFLGWQRPRPDKFSVTGVYVGSWLKGKLFPMTTSTEGSRRAMVPVGSYERVMPLDVLPTQLLRALIVEDTEQAQALGALELDEDDLALCTYVCPGKYEYGSILRENLTRIEKEG